MTVDYRSQTVLLTGASSGIGAAFARALAARGASLVLVARDAERLAAIADDLRRITDAPVEVIAADLSRPAAAAEIHRAVTDRGIHVTGLINNAGIGSFALLTDADPEHLDAEIAVDVIAPVRLTATFLPQIMSAGTGFIINVGSVSAYFAVARMAVYNASKAFVLNFTESLWTELRGTGVTVFAVSPGATATAFTNGMGPEARVLTAGKLRTPEEVVATALRHLERRDPGPVVIDGRTNRLSVFLTRLLTRRRNALLAARIFDPARLPPQPARNRTSLGTAD